MFVNITTAGSTSETIDWTTEIDFVASPIDMPKDYFTNQKLAWFA
jgi:hypothetical protein